MCMGRVSKQLHGAFLPGSIKQLQGPDSFCWSCWIKLQCCCLSRVDGPAVGGRTAPLSLVLLGKWREGRERGCYWEDKGTFIQITPEGWLRSSQNQDAVIFTNEVHFLSNSCVLHPGTVNHSDTAQRSIKITVLFSMWVFSAKQSQRIFERGIVKPWKATWSTAQIHQIKAPSHVSALQLYKACWYQPFQMGVGWEASLLFHKATLRSLKINSK